MAKQTRQERDNKWQYAAVQTRLYPDITTSGELDAMQDAADALHDRALDFIKYERKFYGFFKRWLEHFRPEGERDYPGYNAMQPLINKWRQEVPGMYLLPVGVIRGKLKNAEEAYAKCDIEKRKGNYKVKPKRKTEKTKNCKDMRRSMNNIHGVGHVKIKQENNQNRIRLPYIKKPVLMGDIDELPDGYEVTEIAIAKEWGKYTISVNYRYPKQPPKDISGREHAGIDLGITNTIATSDGKDPKRFNMSESTLQRLSYLESERKRIQISMSSKKPIEGEEPSKNYLKEQKKLNAVYKKIANICKNHRHQITARIEKEYGVIVIEDLGVKQLLALSNRKLARRMAQTGWGEIIRMLKYKMGEDRVIEVNPAYLSQKCNVSNCGHINRNNRHGEKFRCKKCGHEHHADINAALNILEAGIVSRPDIDLSGALKMHQSRCGVPTGSPRPPESTPACQRH